MEKICRANHPVSSINILQNFKKRQGGWEGRKEGGRGERREGGRKEAGDKRKKGESGRWSERKREGMGEREGGRKRKNSLKDFFFKGISTNQTVNLIWILIQTSKKIWKKMFLTLKQFKI